MIPDYQTLMLPLLKLVADKQEHKYRDLIENLAIEFQITEDERKEVLYEEAFVIAMERLGHLPTRAAYNSAQQGLVTRLHPVWLADFIIENWNNYYWNATNSKFYEQYKTIKD